MKRSGWATLMAAFGGMAGAAAGDEANLRSLVEAERAFARTSITSGMRTAFLEHLADDGVVFRPGPVNGREWFQAAPPANGTLAWEPAIAECAASGDFGYTSGPWSFTAGDGSGRVGHGQYFSVWKKSAAAVWRVAIDIGIGHPPPAASQPAWSPGPRPVTWRAAASEALDAAALRSELHELERRFSDAAREDLGAAYGGVLAPDAVVLRMGSEPARGAEAGRLAAGAGANGTWTVERLDVAGSGELAYTSGPYELMNGAERASGGYFMRVWRRLPGGDWKIAVDLWQPVGP